MREREIELEEILAVVVVVLHEDVPEEIPAVVVLLHEVALEEIPAAVAFLVVQDEQH